MTNDFTLQSGYHNGTKDRRYRHNIGTEFCSLQVVARDPGNNNGDLLPAGVRWIPFNNQLDFCLLQKLPDNERPMNNYITAMGWSDTQLWLLRDLWDGLTIAFSEMDGVQPDSRKEYDVPVFPSPPPSAQAEILKQLQSKDHYKFESIAEQLKWQPIKDELKTFHKVHRQFDISDSLMGICQPVLACVNWDWHGAIASTGIMHFASMLGHVLTDEWEQGEPDCLLDWIRLHTLEGSPRGHPQNSYLQYFVTAKNDSDCINETNLQANRLALHNTFDNLAEQCPTRSATPDAVAELRGARTCSVECKSSSGDMFQGEGNQAIVMCDQFCHTNKAVGLHTTNDSFRIQVNEVAQDRNLVTRTIFRCTGFSLLGDPIDRNSPLAVERRNAPRLDLATLVGSNSNLKHSNRTLTKWVGLDYRFRRYIFSVMETVQSLYKVWFVEMQLHLKAKRAEVIKKFNGKWGTGTQLPHYQSRFPDIPDQIQTNLHYTANFTEVQLAAPQPGTARARRGALAPAALGAAPQVPPAAVRGTPPAAPQVPAAAVRARRGAPAAALGAPPPPPPAAGHGSSTQAVHQGTTTPTPGRGTRRTASSEASGSNKRVRRN